MADRSVSVVLRAQVSGYLADLATAKQATLEMAGSMADGAAAGNEGFRELAAGAAAFGTAVLGGVGLAVAKFAEFDVAMSQVQAATHASEEAMAGLEQAALSAGSSTQFSATEAAEGITALAKAGVNADQIIGGALKGSLDLAAAGALDVGDAAEIAATAMTQFGLAGYEVPHVADLLAAAAGKAQGEVTDMAGALNQAGLVAGQMGLSIEETTGTLAAFASQGLIGSDAGTSFRTMLLRLANPSREAAELMDDLGLTAYDAAGQFVGLEGFAGQLQDRLGGLTQQQRDAALATIFGSDAIRGANVLYAEGSAGIADWAGKVNDAGYAAETAALLTDNLAGDVERLGGAFDTALIQSGSGANDVLRLLAQSATGLVDQFSALPGPVQAGAVGFATLAGAAFATAGAYGLLAPKIAAANTALLGLGQAGMFASSILRTTAVAVGAVGLAAVAASMASDALREDVVLTGDAAAASVLAIGRAGGITQASMDAMGGEFIDFGKAMDAIDLSTMDQLQGFFTDDPRHAADYFATIDNGLVQLMQSGQAAAANDSFNVLADQAALYGVTLAELATVLPQYSQMVEASVDGLNTALAEAATGNDPDALAKAILDVNNAIASSGLTAQEAAAKYPGLVAAQQQLVAMAPELAAGQGLVELSIRDVAGTAEAAAGQFDALQAAMDRMNGGYRSVQSATAAATLGLEALRATLSKTDNSFNTNTLAGAENYQQLDAQAGLYVDVAESIYQATLATDGSSAAFDAYTTSLGDSRGEMYRMLQRMGLMPDAALAITNAVLTIPTEAEVNAELNDGVTPALDAIAARPPIEAPVVLAWPADTAFEGAIPSPVSVVVNPVFDDAWQAFQVPAPPPVQVDVEYGPLPPLPWPTGPDGEPFIGPVVVGLKADTGPAEDQVGNFTATDWATLVTADGDMAPAEARIAATIGVPWATVITADGNTEPARSDIGGVTGTNWRATITADAKTGDAIAALDYAAKDRYSTIYVSEVKTGGSIGGLAEGGPMAAATPYLVGERGPELVFSSQAAYVATAAQTASLRQASPSLVPAGSITSAPMGAAAAPVDYDRLARAVLNQAPPQVSVTIGNKPLEDIADARIQRNEDRQWLAARYGMNN